MILARYNYRYALLPKDAAKNIGLGWRKTDKNNMVMINLSELKQLPGEGAIEDKVNALGGQIMTPEEAMYYSKTNTFSLQKAEAKKTESKPTNSSKPVEQMESNQSAAQPQTKPLQEEVSQTEKTK